VTGGSLCPQTTLTPTCPGPEVHQDTLIVVFYDLSLLPGRSMVIQQYL